MIRLNDIIQPSLPKGIHEPVQIFPEVSHVVLDMVNVGWVCADVAVKGTRVYVLSF